MPTTPINLYGILFLIGIGLTAWIWSRLLRQNQQHDFRLTMIYFAGLFGALLGAKLAFFFAEGWQYRDNWLALLSGRSITGAILGGYAAVEFAKYKLSYRHTTGDLFAIVVPIGIALGRIGCLTSGCCPGVECSDELWFAWPDAEGVARWPSQWMEFGFQIVFLIWAVTATRLNWQTGNRFHIYLIGYGLFRFIHEFARERVELIGPISGYQIIALGMVVFGVWRYVQRRGRESDLKLNEIHR